MGQKHPKTTVKQGIPGILWEV